MAETRIVFESTAAWEEHLARCEQVVREKVAKEIEAAPRIHPSRFAWLYYPTYMEGMKAGIEDAARIARGGA